MANISLTKENIRYIRDAFSHFFPEDAIYSADKPFVSGEFNWNNRRAFIDFIYRLTGVAIKSEKDFANIKKSELAVEELVESKKETPESNRPTNEQLEVLEEQQKVRAAVQKKSAIDAKAQVEASIKKQQEIQASLKNKKIYAKVEISKEAPAPNESTTKFIEEAKNYPQSFQKDLAENIKAKLSPTLAKNLTPEEINILADKTAYDTVNSINNFSAQSAANTQSAILTALAKDSKVLPKIVSDQDALGMLKTASLNLGYFENNTQLSKFVLSSVNENLASSVFGTGPENLKVSFFDQPIDGYTHEIDFGQLNQGYSDLLGSQSKIFDSMGSYAGADVKSVLMSQARAYFDAQIANLPADSVISGFYNSELGQQVLSFAGFSRGAPLGESFLGGFLRQIPGASTFFEGLGNTLGIDFAMGAAAPAAEIASAAIAATEGTAVIGGAVAGGIGTGIAAVGGAAVGVETGVAVGAATGVVAAGVSTGAAAGAAAGAGGGPLAIITAAIGAIGGWIASKIDLSKVKEWGAAIIGGTAGLIALPFLGIGSAIGIGLGATALSAGLGAGLGGATLGGVAAGIGGFFSALGGAFLGAIGTPILVTLLAFPIVVALLLFIINSGAYIVPPGNVSGAIENPYIGIEKVATPPGPFANSELPMTISYTVTIKAKKGILTKVNITDDCKAFNESGSINCPMATIPQAPESISPSSSFTFTYTTNYESGTYFDSLITNSVTVSALVDGKLESATGGTSITVGKPPSDCLVLEGTWPSNYRSLAQTAVTTLSSNFSKYMSKVCSSGQKVSVVFSQSCPLGWNCYGAWHSGKLWLMPGALDRGQNYTLFTLAHETGHYLQDMTDIGKRVLFDGYQNSISPPDICSYRNTIGNYAESFAETIGRYASNQADGCFGGSFKSKYPANWQYANDVIFK